MPAWDIRRWSRRPWQPALACPGLTVQVCLFEIVLLGAPFVLRSHHEMTPPAAIVTGDTDLPYIEYCKKQQKSSYDDCILKYELGIMPKQLEQQPK
jgi:hypothetical protein